MDAARDPSSPDALAARLARRRALLVLGAILLVAVALRWPWLWGGPGYWNRDEMNYVPKAVKYGGGDLSPHYFQNPPFASYLMFGGLGVQYAVGRLTGAFSGSLDYKAHFLTDPAPTFHVARGVMLLFALASIAATFAFARRLVGKDVPDGRRTLAGARAAGVLVLSPVHAERSASATNEVLVSLFFLLSAAAAVRLVTLGTVRAALLAGFVAGLTAGAKYPGAIVCASVGLAALLARGRTTRERWTLAVLAGAASAAGFLLVCPWAILEHDTFRSHLEDLFRQRDRGSDPSLDGSLARTFDVYFTFAWTDGLLPAGCFVAVAGIVGALRRVLRRDVPGTAAPGLPDRDRTLVVLAAALPIVVYLLSHTRMANGRYLIVAYPVLAALGASVVCTWTSRPFRFAAPLALGALAVSGVLAHRNLPDLYARARARDTQDVVADWLRAHAPEGAIVVGDWHAPLLVSPEARREFEGKVPPATLDRMRPGLRRVAAYDYFALPLNAIPGTGRPVDDFDALRATGPAFVVLSDLGEATFSKLPAGDYPPQRWYAKVRAELPEVFRVSATDGLRGPTLVVHAVR